MALWLAENVHESFSSLSCFFSPSSYHILKASMLPNIRFIFFKKFTLLRHSRYVFHRGCRAVKTNMTDKLCWKRNFTYCCMQEAPRTLRGFISASPSLVFNFFVFLSTVPHIAILAEKMHSFGFHGNSNNSFLLMSQFLLLSCACGITDTLGQRPPLCFVLAEGNPQQGHLLPGWPEKLTNFNTKY